MTNPEVGRKMVDKGWGRRAVDFATLSQPANCCEYVAVQHRLRINEGDRVLDVACGSRLAIELARARGAECAGIDASPRVGRRRAGQEHVRRHPGGRHALVALG